MAVKLKAMEVKLRKLNRDNPESTEKVAMLIEMGEYLMSGDDPQRLVEVTAELRRLSQQLQDSKGEAHSLWCEGLSCCFIAEHENGLNGSIDLSFVDETAFGFFNPGSLPLPLQPTVVELDDYTRVDARIGYKFRDPEIEMSLILQNAFDDEHQEFPLGEVLQSQVFFQVYGRF